MSEKPTMTLNLSEREMAVVEQLCRINCKIGATV